MLLDVLNLDGHAFQFNIIRFAFAGNLGEALFGNAWSGNQQLLDLVLACDFAQQSVAAKNAQTMNNLSPLFRIVVHKTDGSITQFAIVFFFFKQKTAYEITR